MQLFQSSWVLMPHPSTRDYGNLVLNIDFYYYLKPSVFNCMVLNGWLYLTPIMSNTLNENKRYVVFKQFNIENLKYEF